LGPFSKAAADAQPLILSQGERSLSAAPRLPPRPGHGRMTKERRRITKGAI
jgi:hypothetical protein